LVVSAGFSCKPISPPGIRRATPSSALPNFHISSCQTSLYTIRVYLAAHTEH
jgi:hypothetical protein